MVVLSGFTIALLALAGVAVQRASTASLMFAGMAWYVRLWRLPPGGRNW
jgi:hypothetical protein